MKKTLKKVLPAILVFALLFGITTSGGASGTADHDWSEWVYNKDATFFRNGTKTRTCRNCGAVQTMESPRSSLLFQIFFPRNSVLDPNPPENRFLDESEIFRFSNDYNNFTYWDAEPDENIYTMKNAHFKKLTDFVKKTYGENSSKTLYLINYLQSERNKRWEGSCYGMSATVILDKIGQINFNENFDPDAKTIYETDLPIDNPDVMSAINYYQLSQCIPVVNKAMIYKNNPGWSYDLKKAVNSAKNGKLMLFSFNFIDNKNPENSSGHALVIIGYEPTEDGGHNLIAYDNRWPQKDYIINVSEDYLTCKIPEGPNVEITSAAFADDFDFLKPIDIDGGDDGSTPLIRLLEARLFNSRTTLLATGDVKITNSKGEVLKISDGLISGTMRTYSTRMIVNSTADGRPAPASFMIDVKNDALFKFEPLGGKIDVSVVSPDMFAKVKANGRSARVEKGKGAYIDGSTGYYEASLSFNDGSGNAATVSGNNDPDAALEYDGDGVKIKGVKGGDSRLTVFCNAWETEEITLPDDCGQMKVDVGSENIEISALPDGEAYAAAVKPVVYKIARNVGDSEASDFSRY